MVKNYEIGDVLYDGNNDEHWLIVDSQKVMDLDFDTDEVCTKVCYTLMNIFNYETYGTIKLFAWDLSETEYLGNIKNMQPS